LSPEEVSAEVIGSMIDYVEIADGNGPLITQMADPAIRIVALTVTEGGYYIDPATKSFDTNHPDMIHDAANPDEPRTAFGAMISALKIRRDQDIGPFTGQSCDNLQGNGEILRQTVVSLATMSDPGLADWIDTHCTFPNSMVDSIAPATGTAELDLVRELGVEDNAPVTHENFRQWVIEDRFCAGRPDWDLVGATFTDLVHDYEAMKIRILNAGHQVIANSGELLSVETISGCMEHPLINALLRKVELEEIVPHVKPVPGMELADYVDLIATRFSNPKIVDTTRRVAFDGSSRHTGFVLPILRDGLAEGTSVTGLALVEAIWARMCEGTREDGSAIEPNDPFWEDLTNAAAVSRKTPRAWLDQRQYYGNLASESRFADAFENWLGMIWAEGLTATLETYLNG
jgi:mannitol 2-dehydrogenase